MQRLDENDPLAKRLLMSFPSCARYVGDSLCWSIPLDTSGLGTTSGIHLPRAGITLPHDPVCTVSWFMDIRRFEGIREPPKRYFVINES